MHGCDGALVVDPNGVGYYRVQYDSASFGALAGQVARLPDAARLKLLTDSWAMVQGGRMQLDGYFKLIESYRDEPRKAIWQAMLASLAALDALARDRPEQPLIQRFILGLAGPRLARLGWEEKSGDAPEERELRPMLAEALAAAGDAGAIGEAKKRFVAHLAHAGSVAPSMIDFVVGTAGRHADSATFDVLLQWARSTQQQEQLYRYGLALLAARDPALAARALQLALSDSLPANFTSLVVPAVADAGHIDLAWAFAQTNRSALLRDQEAIRQHQFFPSLVESSNQVRHAEMMEQWIAKEFGPDAQPAARQAANAIRTRAMQQQRMLAQVRAALK